MPKSALRNHVNKLSNENTAQNLNSHPSDAPEETITKNIDSWYYVRGIVFLGIMIIVLLALAYGYMSLHGINIVERVLSPGQPFNFDFVGGKSNIFGIGMEILFWSLVGVICQMAYLSGQMIISKQFEFWVYLIRWISTSLYSAGIAHAVIFTLQIVKLSIAGVEITLENAPPLTIMAIAFILGFYNQEARDLLDKFRARLSAGFEDK